MTPDWKILQDNRQALLLAEVAAWLHMLGKFHEDFLNGNHKLATEIPQDIPQKFPKLNQLLEENWAGKIWVQMGVQGFQAGDLSIASLVTEHQNPKAPTGFQRLMQDAHGRGSASEKGALERFIPDRKGSVYLSTAFGYETHPIDTQQIQNARQVFYAWLEGQLDQLRNNLNQIDWHTFRQAFLTRIREDFLLTVAETRQPINDVSLFDQTFASVAVFKAALAQNLLLGWKEPQQKNVRDKYHWRILRVGIDGLQFWGQTAKLTDLLGRKAAIERALDSVQRLLEEDYPLGAEVYRDENGSLFLVPDVDDLLIASLEGGIATLQQHLQQISQRELEGEATFTLTLSDRTRTVLSLGRLISEKLPPSSPNPQEVLSIWQSSQKTTDVCSVCGVRPQGYEGKDKPLNQKALSRNVCGICERRRAERASIWVCNLRTTVWTDEVADENGRLALIVGRFGLEHWLTGEALASIMAFEPSARTLQDRKQKNSQYSFAYKQFVDEIQQALQSSQQPGSQTPLLDYLLLPYQRVGNSFADTYDFYVGDSDLSRDQREAHLLALALMRQQPSPARLRRIWETTRGFWQEVAPTQKDLPLAKSLVGLVVGSAGPRLEIIPAKGDSLNLGPFHTYELVVNGIHLSVVWDSNKQRFITCDNLDYLAKPEFLGRSVKEALEKTKGQPLRLEEPVGYGGKNKAWGKIKVKEVRQLSDTYTPAIPILAEPRTFMALVPANRALEVVKAIQAKYEREMGKVRNRLPLTLGVVYFGRRTPLAAAIETGRRILARPQQRETWVISKASSHSSNDNWPSAVCLTLKREETEVCLSIPTVMGDGQTPDLWYPYWQVKDKPNGRTRWFVGPDGEHWVHVTKLRSGDRVEFMPSTFDYEYLDTTARRFEVIYDQNGQRLAPEKYSRPYLLEEIQTLEAVWQKLSQNLSTSQIKAIESLIEGKRRQWEQPYSAQRADETFCRFVKDVLHEAGIWGETLELAALRGLMREDAGVRVPERPDQLELAALRGLMREAIEIHMTLHKEKTAKDQA
ncbi:MAG: CRISPR-associated protein Csx11 [Anaerolineales bacterium]